MSRKSTWAHLLSMILVETPAFIRLYDSMAPLGPAPTTRTSMKLVLWDCMSKMLRWRDEEWSMSTAQGFECEEEM